MDPTCICPDLLYQLHPQASQRTSHTQELSRGHLAAGKPWTFGPGNPHPGKPGMPLCQGRPGWQDELVSRLSTEEWVQPSWGTW